MSKPKRKRIPKAVLQLPDLEQSKSAVLNSLASQSSQRSYDHAIREFIEWYCSEPRLAFNKTVVTRKRIFLEQAHYASSTINLRLAAVRRLAYEAADAGLLSSDLAAGIRRVKGGKKLGVRIGNWLTAEQGRRLLGVFDRQTLRGVRDYAMVAVLLGCGLRRAELAALTVQDLQQREEHWVFADLIGKGGQRQDRACSVLDRNRLARLGFRREDHRRSDLSRNQQGGTDRVPWLQPEGDLGRREASLLSVRSRWCGTPRPSSHVRPLVP
jgi:site-specific recombinase XerD